MDVHEPDEDFESIPWASVSDRGGRPAWQPAMAGVVLGAAVVFLAFRPSAEPEAVESASPSVTVTVPDPTTIPTTAPPPSLLPEADLMAVESTDLAAEAGRVAEWFLTDFFTVDDSGRSAAERWIALPDGYDPPSEASVAVEGVEVVDARRTAPDRVVVTAVVRRFLVADPATVDRTAFEIEVAFGDAGARVVDLPNPVTGPSHDVPPDVVAAGVVAVEPLVADDLLASEVDGGIWRLVFAARDAFGMVWPVAVTVDAGTVPDVPGDQEK